MTSASALWAGPGARRALAAGGAGRVEFALHPGGYARLGDEWLLLAIPRAPRGPLTLLVAGLDAGPPAVGDEVAVERDMRARWLAGPAGVASPVTAGAAASPDRASPARADGLAALRRGGGAALAGRGEGLTPAGDDALAGYAAWRHASDAPVALDGGRCSPLGLAYLRCAERGELPEPVAALVHAIRAGDAVASGRRARALSRWGASSGAAMLWGIAAAASS